MAESEPDWDGYTERSQQVEAKAWEGALKVQTPHGEILIKKACKHPSCPHTECLRSDLRLEGFAILMSCAMCNQEIGSGEVVNLHHGPIYRSDGGTVTGPIHRSFHLNFHSRAGDFREWGRKLNSMRG